MLAKLKEKKALCICLAVALVIVAIVLVVLLTRSNQPASESVSAGQNIVVTITADSIEDLYGYQFRIIFDKEKLEYTGVAESRIDGITSIFSVPMEGYELIGATMIGDESGVSGQNIVVCEITFTAKIDGSLDDFNISITDVNVVTSSGLDLDYIEGVEGWELVCMVQE